MSKKRNILGKLGEDLAVDYLKDKKYRILQRNVRSIYGELDIVAQESDTLCFIEVKTRTSNNQGHPFESITKSKRRKITLNALNFLKDNNLVDRKSRFDVVSVIPQDEDKYHIELLKDAFEAEQ